MRIKRVLPLLATTLLTLSACGKDPYLGDYTFQMGRDKGVHVRATLELLSDEVREQDDDAELLGKKFKFKADINMGKKDSETEPQSLLNESTSESESQTSESGSGEEGEDLPNSPEDFLKLVYEILGDGDSINGYYYIGDPIKGGSKELHLGFIVTDSIKEEAADAANIDLSGIGINPDTTEKLLYSTINEKQINISVPVSFEDLMYQLYWYGTDIYIDSESLHIDDVTEHKAGTHPTDEEIAAINADPKYKEHHGDSPFRDFHVLTLGLLKE